MAKIPLRAYTKEIENLIERGEIEQAVSHAKNILKSYPKHIDTYRLLGKAYLESQRYSEAADILQRVLSVLPDDFISQIGMSIIREDEGNLDAAIWHMERAYEVQPFNSAVQEELRRLYGRRDGVEPPKIRLTRGALVRMYTRGELYPQAIAETRAALAEDPQRLDLLVLLARLYYLSDHKNDAAEVCSELIHKLPYCYEANRLLAEFLPTTSRAEEAQKFQQRIFALDPYAAFISPTAPTSDQVPDQAVMVEQFSLDQAVEEAQIPDWARTVGVEGWEETEEEPLPDWLNTLKPEPSKTGPLAAPEAKAEEEPLASMEAASTGEALAGEEAAAPEAAAEAARAQEGEAEKTEEGDMIPDWMKEAGWVTADRPADEIMAAQEEAESAQSEEIAPADLPEWMQSIAPVESRAAAEDQERTDWLESLLTEPGGSNGKEAEGIPPAAADLESAAVVPGEAETGEEHDLENIPDWMKDIGTGDQAASSETTEAGLPDWFTQLQEEKSPGETKPVEFEGLPDWTQLSEPTTTEPAPDWLQSLAGKSLEEPAGELPAEPGLEEEAAQPAEISEPVLEAPQAGEATLPESALEETAPVLPEAKTPAAETTPGAMPDLNSMSMDEAMAWLESLAAKQGADEATLVTPPEQRTEKPPEWVAHEMETVQPVEAQPPAGTVSAEAVGEEPEVVEEAQIPVEPQIHETPASEEMDWLKQAEASAPEVMETTLQTPEQPATKEQPAVEEQPVFEEQPAVEAQPAVPDFSDMDAAMAWLESLAAKQGADEATLVTPPEQRLEKPPEWVTKEMEIQSLAHEEKSAVAAEAETAEAEEPAVAEIPAIEPAETLPAAEESPAEPPVFEMLQAEPPEAEMPEAELPVSELPAAETLAIEQPLTEDKLLAEEQPATETPQEPMPAAEMETPPAEPETKPAAEEDLDATFAWLESLAAKQGADEATLVTTPEERQETPPKWLQQEQEFEQELEPGPGEETPAAETQVPDWLQNIHGEPGAEFLMEPGAELKAEEEIPDWLQNIGQEEPAQATSAEQPQPWADQSQPWAEQSKPWTVEEQTEPAETESPLTGPADMEWAEAGKSAAPEEATAQEEGKAVPEWLLGLENEPAPTGEGLALPLEYRSEWQPEAEYNQPGESQPQAASAQSLEEVQKALSRGRLDHALEGYNSFIQKGMHLEETIHDLRDALYRYPVDINIYQTLGDAYARNNQLQEALDAYTKAEELLR